MPKIVNFFIQRFRIDALTYFTTFGKRVFMRYLPNLLTICFLFLTPLVSGQYYETGQDPGSLKWMQIKTDRFRIIYPESYGTAGIDFARSLDDGYARLTNLYPEKKFRIPVIIHNYTTQSNGYVAWAPDRMELYPTPEQNSIPADPDKLLAIHELTHVLQMESLNKGFTRVMSWATGQQFPGIVSSLLPLWFLEGDAVFSESVLTESGRGRTPSFQKQFKAIMLEKGTKLKYDKIVNGSFRDFVPDHYHSGYQIMAWSYARYGRDLWKKALDQTAREPFTINPVNLSLNRSASMTKKRLYMETFDSLKTLWRKDDAASGSQYYEESNPPKGEKYINYYSPVIAGNDSIIAVKTSLTDTPSFVLIRPSVRSEKKIFTPGNTYPWFISFGKGKLVWVEQISDPRWENRSWSVIKLHDINKKTTRQLSVKTRYMSASISSDGNYIAATENTVDNRNNLVILDGWNGDEMQKVPAPENAYLQRPQWDHSGEKVTVIYLTDQGEGIMSYSITEKKWDVLIEPDNNDLQSSFLRNDSLLFVSSSSGTDNIYLLKPDKTIVPLTNSRFGVSDLSLTGYEIIFSDYSSSGNNICRTILPGSEIDLNVGNASSSYLINRFDPNKYIPRDYTEQVYNPVPYRKWQHLFRFHSWMPFYADIEQVKSDPTSVRPGFTLMTQNNLSTLISTIGYEYSDNMHKFHSGLKWTGWYFTVESRLDYGNNPVIEKFKQTVNDPDFIRTGYELTNVLSLPLSFRGRYFTQNLFLSASSIYQNNYLYLKEKGYYDTGQNQFTGRIYFSNYSRSAVRDIYPRWAQIMDISYSFYPFDKEFYGNISTVRSAFYFPGFLKNNGFKVRVEGEKQKTAKFVLGNRASFSRSYDNVISSEIQFLSGDYFMPLAYPDFNLASLIYLTRIRTDLFYDHTNGTGNYVFTFGSEGHAMEFHDYKETFRSFGAELMADFYVFRLPFMVSAGVQAAWRSLDKAPYLKLLFNIDLFGMNIGRRRI